MKCYVVSRGQYSDYQILAIRSTKTAAETLARHPPEQCGRCDGTGKIQPQFHAAGTMMITGFDEIETVGGHVYEGGTNRDNIHIPARKCDGCKGTGTVHPTDDVAEFDFE